VKQTAPLLLPCIDVLYQVLVIDGDNCRVISGMEEEYLPFGRVKTASVVRWSEVLATEVDIPDSIPHITSFSEKYWVLNGL
jgi:hypothetical protein